MIPVFLNDAAWAAMKQIAESWLGTPYRHMQVNKGRGADCTLFLAACLREAGYLTKIEYGYYPRDWHQHTTQEIVMEGFMRHTRGALAPGLAMVEADGSLRGDLMLLAATGTGVSHHTVMRWEDDRVIHAHGPRGVHLAPFGARFLEAVTSRWRLVRP
jgi:cell wall-associated NlpC family hydrolase